MKLKDKALPAAVTATEIPFWSKRSGKVRDVYDTGENLLIVATDRISAYDSVLANGIPCKGRVLTSLSLFWFDFLKDVAPNHLVASDVTAADESSGGVWRDTFGALDAGEEGARTAGRVYSPRIPQRLRLEKLQEDGLSLRHQNYLRGL